MVSRQTTVLIVEEELAGAQAWSERRAVPLTWVPELLEVRATFAQPGTGELFYLRGRFDDYRVLPPAWTFTDAAWSAEPAPQLFPRPMSGPYGASMFHGNAVICAPFNRLAYVEHKGPHSDWGGPASWLTAGAADQVKAHVLGDMLHLILRDMVHSSGRMG